MDRWSSVLRAARPYLLFLVILTLSPPPPGCSRRLRLGHAAYTLVMGIMGIYVSYNNVISLFVQMEYFELKDFTSILGIIQKSSLALYLVVIHLNMLLNYRRLIDGIFVRLQKLDHNIRLAALPFDEVLLGDHTKNDDDDDIHFRLAIRCGLQGIFLIVSMPATTSQSQAWLEGFNRIATTIILIMLELKCMEFCLYVLMIEQLLLRLRYTLSKLQIEVNNIQHTEIVRPLCDALCCNQRLTARIWQLVEELETYSMLPMLCLFLFNGLTVLHLVNWSYILELEPLSSLNLWRFGNIIILMTNLLLPCWISYHCINTYDSFTRILHTMHSPHQMVTMRVREYKLQMQHLKLRFTCGGLFDINLKYFGAIILALASYTLLIIQFKMQASVESN